MKAFAQKLAEHGFEKERKRTGSIYREIALAEACL
jgi:hypothetical protein